MDYETKPTSRESVRLYSQIFREIFGLPQGGEINPLMLLDRMCEIFDDVSYEIVERRELPRNVPANCIMTDSGGFIIQIADYVYEGAYSRNVGGYRMHIMHEILHPYVYKIGFTPIYSRGVENNKIPAFRSVEWIVKAMAGEVMMPYEETIGLNVDELMDKYGVSIQAARQRIKY